MVSPSPFSKKTIFISSHGLLLRWPCFFSVKYHAKRKDQIPFHGFSFRRDAVYLFQQISDFLLGKPMVFIRVFPQNIQNLKVQQFLGLGRIHFDHLMETVYYRNVQPSNFSWDIFGTSITVLASIRRFIILISTIYQNSLTEYETSCILFPELNTLSRAAEGLAQ